MENVFKTSLDSIPESERPAFLQSVFRALADKKARRKGNFTPSRAKIKAKRKAAKKARKINR